MSLNQSTETNLESVIMHIASRFINVPYDEYEKRLDEALKLIGSFLNIDRVYMFDYDFEKNVTNNLFEWCNKGVEPQIMYLQAIPLTEIVDEWLTKHKKNEMVIYEDVEALNHESMVYKILNPQGVLSICTIPLTHHDECLGFVGFDDVREKRIWIDSEFKLLSVLAELIVNTLIKQKTDHALFVLRENAVKANEAKSKFLAHMSHEIRTPLNGIHNAFYLLSQSNSVTEQQKYMQIAQTSLDFLTSIVNNILDISKIEAGKMNVNYNTVDLEFELVKTVRSLRLSMKQKALKCIFTFDDSIDKNVVVDLQKINQIVINLVNNAIKYTQDGFIRISVKKIEKDNGQFLAIAVEDNGIGISFEDQKRLTEAFFQYSNQSGSVTGTGLGLSIVNQLVELMGGKLFISSIPNVGSTFEISLPLVTSDSLAYEKIYEKILLISDHSEFYSTYKGFFSSFSKEVVTYNPDVEIDQIELVIFDESMIKDDSLRANELMNQYLDIEKVFITDDRQTASVIEKIIEAPISKKDFIQFMKSRDISFMGNSTLLKTYKGNILVVDDNLINRDALKSIIVKHGLNCELAAGGYQAIELCKVNRYDLILMDIQMPQIDGYETAMKIRANRIHEARTPIVAITANVFLNDYDLKMATHIEDILFKPVKMDELLNVFDTYLYPAKSNLIPDDILLVNLNTIESIFEGNPQAAVAMVDQFLLDCYKDLDSIRDMMALKDQTKIHKSLHYFKGPLSYFGADRLLFLIDLLMKKNNSGNEITKSEYRYLSFELTQFTDEIKGAIDDFSNR
jgi:signal transduction histidine kinase/CheY-like chemotaxis protein